MRWVRLIVIFDHIRKRHLPCSLAHRVACFALFHVLDLEMDMVVLNLVILVATHLIHASNCTMHHLDIAVIILDRLHIIVDKCIWLCLH